MKQKKMKSMFLCILALAACGVSFADEPTVFRCTSGGYAGTIIISPPLQQAILAGNEVLASELIAEGADVNEVGVQRSVRDGERPMYSPLEAAVVRGSIPMVQMLLDEGADINLEGHSPLVLAAKLNNEEMVCFLLGEGADPNARDIHGKSALMFAQSHFNYEMAEMLADAGALNRFQLRSLPRVF